MDDATTPALPALAPERPVSTTRTEPQRDGRRLIIYFVVLLLVYAVGFVLTPSLGFNTAVIVIMFAPAIAALAVRFLGPGVLWWGRPSWWILAGLLPVLVVLLVLLTAAGLGWIDFYPDLLKSALLLAPFNLLGSMVLAFGEELGWRGFLWPQLRVRMGFLAASAVMALIWLAYHVPVVMSGDYGALSGLPAFTVALVGFVLFVGVITERSRSLWPSVVAHGAWNTLAANGFAAAAGSGFVGDGLVGEFGWLNAVAMLALGAGATWWHLASGRGAVLPRVPAVPATT